MNVTSSPTKVVDKEGRDLLNRLRKSRANLDLELRIIVRDASNPALEGLYIKFVSKGRIYLIHLCGVELTPESISELKDISLGPKKIGRIGSCFWTIDERRLSLEQVLEAYYNGENIWPL